MRYIWFPWAVLLLPVLLGGCKKAYPTASSGGLPNSTHESVMVDAVTSMQTTAKALNQVRDIASAEHATQVVQRETRNLQRLRQRLVELGTASEAEASRVQQHSQEVIDAVDATKQATATAVSKTQGGQIPRDVTVRLLTATREYGQAMVDFGNQAKPLFD